MSEGEGDQNLAIREVLPLGRAETLQLLLRDDPSELRDARVADILQSARRGELSFEHLLAGYRGARLVAAAWGQILPGRVAAVWPPRLVAGEPASTAQLLLAEILARLPGQGVQVAHALLTLSGEADVQPLLACGFAYSADLAYLASSRDRFPLHQPPGPLEFAVGAAEHRGRLSQLIEETYRLSLDIPALNGLRRMQDVLDGYQQTGVFDPQRWLFVTHQGESIGCLLLTDHPDHDQWELMYMGLLPRARAHGWGLQIARHAQWLTGKAGRERLVLAVDAENEPAVVTYARAGFYEWDRRRVFLRSFVVPRF